MTLSRRTLLQYGGLVAGTRFIRVPAWRDSRRRTNSVGYALFSGWRIDDPANADVMFGLAQRAVDAAIAAGATYADVRLTHTVSEAYTSGTRKSKPPQDARLFAGMSGLKFGGTTDGVSGPPRSVTGIPDLTLGLGVRAFARGYWGFAASPDWTDADATRLGNEAAAQAIQISRVGEPRPTELGAIPIVHRERWVQPGIDPFAVPVDEKLAVLRSFLELPVQGHRFIDTRFGLGTCLKLWREERVFASSEGASYSQVRYRCMPEAFVVTQQGDIFRGEPNRTSSASWTPEALSARGWEAIRNIDQDHVVQTLLANARTQQAMSNPGTKPVEIGKYDVIFDAGPAADLVYHTLGMATELDRAMGYEANAGGTSYLGPDPLQYLGTVVASPHVNLTADRTTPHALATAKWDDEGMPCRTFPLITNGTLADYQTTREQAAWLKAWYAKQGLPIQSHACAVAETALDCPIQMSPNFILESGPDAIDATDLIKDTERGVYFPEGWVQVDQQVKNGMYHGKEPREIRNGKLGPVLSGAGVLFSSQELWKNVTALGGSASAQWAQGGETKGEPSQSGQCNVRAVPMKVKDCAIIDTTRKV